MDQAGKFLAVLPITQKFFMKIISYMLQNICKTKILFIHPPVKCMFNSRHSKCLPISSTDELETNKLYS